MTLPKPCYSCGNPTRNGSRCPTCQTTVNAEREATRATPAQRGYDAQHQRRAAALRKQGGPCALCGNNIDYQLRSPDPWSFSAHHVTDDKRGPMVAAHRRCNERAGKPSSHRVTSF